MEINRDVDITFHRHARENGHPLALPVLPTGVIAVGNAIGFLRSQE